MQYDNDVYLDADLSVLTRRNVDLRKDLNDAMEIAGILETGEMPRDSILPHYAIKYFPDAHTQAGPVLVEQSKANWSQYFLQQVWWGIVMLETQLKKPTLRTLCGTFGKVAEWSAEDQNLHLEAIKNLTRECTESIEALTQDGFSTEKLTRKLERTLAADHSGILRTINSEARYLAFMENNLRSHFRMFSETAGSILETCRNDMAETFILYMRSNNRGRNSHAMAEDVRYQGTICTQELNRAAQFHDLADTVLNNLKRHTQECERRILAYGSLSRKDSRSCLN